MFVFLIIVVIGLTAYTLACQHEKRKQEEQRSGGEIADAPFARKRMAVPWI
jgi:hypothetical protein